uniref:BHLH domain-containing protein n=1 Tax=Acrobeloides nanus TaxID=290746 RepID=A0A914CDG3_9BILA
MRKSKSFKRKPRIRSNAQKEAANLRERKRMFDLNLAFESLREKIPIAPYEKRLSRLEILRMAAEYIFTMTNILKQYENGLLDNYL